MTMVLPRLKLRLPRWPRLRLPRPRPRPLDDAAALPAGLKLARSAALWAIAAVVTVATAVALAESYHGLYLWALHHSFTHGWAGWFPLMVDSFTVLGELSLFVAVVDRAPLRYRAYAWLVILVGLAASVAGNAGHLLSATPADRLTDAVPPLAAFVGLTVGMTNLKRVLAVSARRNEPPAVVAAVVSALAGADAKGAVAALVDAGVSDTGTLAAISGVSDRTIRRWKADSSGQEPDSARRTADREHAVRSRHAATMPRLVQPEPIR